MCLCSQECVTAMGSLQSIQVFDACVYDVCLSRQNVTATLCENINSFVIRCAKEFKVQTHNWRNQQQLCRTLFTVFLRLYVSLYFSVYTMRLIQQQSKTISYFIVLIWQH